MISVASLKYGGSNVSQNKLGSMGGFKNNSNVPPLKNLGSLQPT